MTPADARRVLHASTALVLILPPLLGWPAFRFTLLIGLGLWTAVELARLRSVTVSRWLHGAVPVFRPRESRRLSGAWWLLLSFAALSWLPPIPAASGILTGAVADPAAAWAGARWGRPRGARKSWMGTGVAALAAFTVLGLADLEWGVRLVASVMAAAAERWSGPLDDNLVVGPVTGITVLWLA